MSSIYGEKIADRGWILTEISRSRDARCMENHAFWSQLKEPRESVKAIREISELVEVGLPFVAIHDWMEEICLSCDFQLGPFSAETVPPPLPLDGFFGWQVRIAGCQTANEVIFAP